MPPPSVLTVQLYEVDPSGTQIASSVLTFAKHVSVSQYILMDAQAPLPPTQSTYATSQARDGGKLVDVKHGNRQISLWVLIDGTSADNLNAKVLTLRRLCERAQDWSIPDWGASLYLLWQAAGQTNPAYAPVLQADLVPVDFDAGLRAEARHILRLGQNIGTYKIVLTCPPKLDGTPVTLVASQTAYNRFRAPDYRYTHLAGVFSPNVVQKVDGPLWTITAAPPTGANAFNDLTGGVPASGDAVYLGDADVGQTQQPNLNFGVATPLAYSVSPQWVLEANDSNTPTWVAVTGVTVQGATGAATAVANSGATGGFEQVFTTRGMKRVTFTPPGTWTTAASVNAKAGRWLRIRQLATIGTVTAYPLLQWGPIRTDRSLVKVDATTLGGDAPAKVKITAKLLSSERLRTVRVGLWTMLRTQVGAPVMRHGMEYATVGPSAAIDTTFSGSSRDAVLKVGAALTNYAIAFDGVNKGYLSFANALTPSGTLGATLDTLFSVDFFIMPYYDTTVGGSGVSPQPQPLAGIWGSAASTQKQWLLYLEDGFLKLIFSRDGKTPIRYEDPTRAKNEFKGGSQLVSNADPSRRPIYYVRIIRAGQTLFLYSAQMPPGGSFNLSGPRYNAAEVVKKGVSDVASLGTQALNKPGNPLRLGWPFADPDPADAIGGKGAWKPFYGAVEQFRFTRHNAANTVPNTSGLKPGQYSGNDAANNHVGLYLFDDTPGRLVNSQTGGNITGAATRSGSGTADVASWFDQALFQQLQGTARLSWWQLEEGMGWYKVLAAVRSAAADPKVHSYRLSQRGVYLSELDKQVSDVATWQVVDMGAPVKLPPAPPRRGYSPLGSSVDKPEDLGIAVRASQDTAPTAYIDDLITLPADAYIHYDCGPDSSRQLLQNTYLVIDSGVEPPLIGQLDANGYQVENVDTFLIPAEYVLKPGRVHYLGFEMERYKTGGGSVSVREEHPDDQLQIVVVATPQFFHLDTA